MARNFVPAWARARRTMVPPAPTFAEEPNVTVSKRSAGPVRDPQHRFLHNIGADGTEPFLRALGARFGTQNPERPPCPRLLAVPMRPP